jgi:hypothetical protein
MGLEDTYWVAVGFTSSLLCTQPPRPSKPPAGPTYDTTTAQQQIAHSVCEHGRYLEIEMMCSTTSNNKKQQQEYCVSTCC